MTALASDTIAAVATPAGRGGVGIVRISGDRVPDIAAAVLGQAPTARMASFGPFRDASGQPIDEGIAILFVAPHSFTGEHVLELQGHGGPMVMDMLLKRVCELGARPARPGEFSERAFLNDKLDLAQAEAIADLIESCSEQASRSAMRSLRGEFSRHVNELLDALVALRTYIEAELDFPDEEVDALITDEVQSRLRALQRSTGDLLNKARQGSLLLEGMNLVIAGRPNSGKSSLLNRLSGTEAAIVTDLPGTTRDVLKQSVHIDGMPLHIIDTAGLRSSTDPIELEGIRRAWREIEQADAILLLVDDTLGNGPEEEAILARLPERVPILTLYNKIDLTGRRCGRVGSDIFISAKTGAGLVALREALKDLMGFQADTEGLFTARRRHLAALEQTRAHLARASAQAAHSASAELVAEDLRSAQRALGEVTGQFTSEDLLDRIFSSFCIGK